MLEIHLLGQFRIVYQGKLLSFSALPKTLPLWAYLLLHHDQLIARDYLAFQLWPDESEEKARANLRRHLYDLNRVLPPSPVHPWLKRDKKTVQWNPDADWWLDVAEFTALANRTKKSPETLEKAISTYGCLLPNLYDNWVMKEQQRLKGQYLACLEALCQHYKSQNQPERMLECVQKLLDSDPLQEEMVREMMRLQAACGNRVAAMQTYHHFVALWQKQLGVLPMAATTAVYESIRNEMKSPPHNIPAALNPFFGRTVDLLTLIELLTSAEGTPRLITLSGAGGSGKTRLALETVSSILEQHPQTFLDGIFFVDLSSISDPDHLLTAVAKVLALEEKGALPLTVQLATFLQKKHILLILDNFEQLLPAAPLVADILSAAPHCRIIVTSRFRLHVYGEFEYPLSPLPLPEPEQPRSTEALLEFAAVSLFIARARAYQPTFTLSTENANDIVYICQQLDGLPLAIELAAAHIKLFSPATMRQQLQHRLAFLTGKDRNVPQRQQTLRATIKWSYDLLTVQEKSLFMKLGLFAGGFTATAVTAVIYENQIDPHQTLKNLATLTDKNIIQSLQPNPNHQEPRFSMLPTIREFAQELLEQSPDASQQQWQQHHLEYYLEIAKRANSEIFGAEQLMWLKRLDLEEENLRTALIWSLTEPHKKGNIAGADLVIQLSHRYWQVRGKLTEALYWLNQALAHQDRLSPPLQSKLLTSSGWFNDLQGKQDLAAKQYEEALTIARRLKEPEPLALALQFLGLAAGRQGHYKRAEKLFSEALQLENQIHDGEVTRTITILRNNLAIVYKYLKKYDQATVLLHKNMVVEQAQENQLGIASTYTNLGTLALEQGDYQTAVENFRHSLQKRYELADKMGLITSFSGLADVAWRQGDFRRSSQISAIFATLAQTINYQSPPPQQRQNERMIADLRQQLGATSFASYWGKGETMTLAEAVTYALSQ